MTVIKRFRVKHGISQTEFAEKMHVTQQTVSQWELGYKTPRAAKLIRIAELFCCTVDDLLKDDEEGDEKSDQK